MPRAIRILVSVDRVEPDPARDRAATGGGARAAGVGGRPAEIEARGSAEPGFFDSDAIRAEVEAEGFAVKDTRSGDDGGEVLVAIRFFYNRLLDYALRLHYPTCLAQISGVADVAQLAEHLICNQAVASSSLAVSSVVTGDSSPRWRVAGCAALEIGGVAKWPTAADCKSAGLRPTKVRILPPPCGAVRSRTLGGAARRGVAGVAQLVERQPSKLDVAGSSPVSRSGSVER